ncbi:MAG: hypothetical protein RBR94_00520 [Bacilli bacterium]|jgi:hypothetical protein|nr:hypothetical protein [Bacilli bacterium]
MNKNMLTILVSSPESYRDVFDISTDLFLKNWPDCPYYKMYATDFINENLLFSSESSKFYKEFEVFCFPKAREYVARTKNALQKITTKYTLLICDDVFLIKKAINSHFISIIEFMNENEMVYCRINNSKTMVCPKNRISKNLYRITYNQPYGRNLQAAIWNTDFLKHFLLQAPEDAYIIEENWLKDALDKGKLEIKNHCYWHNKYFYHSLIKGKWNRGTKRIIKKQRIQFITERPEISIKTSFLSRFKTLIGRLLSTKSRVKLKNKLSKWFDIDTKF